VVRLPSKPSFRPHRVGTPPRRHRRRLGPIAIAAVAFDDDNEGCPDKGRTLGCHSLQHGVFLALICGGGVRRAVVTCGGGERGGGVRLFSVTRDCTLRGEMKRYVKNNMSGHNFAERGGDNLKISVFMTDIHIIGLKIGLKDINLCLYDQFFYVFVFLGMLHY
jgi:hypothetical protein